MTAPSNYENASEPAVRELVNQLQLAYRSTLKNEDPVTIAQLQHVVGLSAIAKFLDQINAGDDLVEKIHKLAHAISKLSEGVTNPILRRGPLGGRAADDTELWVGRKRVVAALACLMMSGKYENRSKAAEYIAEEFSGLSTLCRPSQGSKKIKLETSILNWEKLSREGKIKDKILINIPEIDLPPLGLDSTIYKRLADDFLKATEAEAAKILA
jgi:hypothetical protein